MDVEMDIELTIMYSNDGPPMIIPTRYNEILTTHLDCRSNLLKYTKTPVTATIMIGIPG